jgi:hypothetical protein
MKNKYKDKSNKLLRMDYRGNKNAEQLMSDLLNLSYPINEKKLSSVLDKLENQSLKFKDSTLLYVIYTYNMKGVIEDQLISVKNKIYKPSFEKIITEIKKTYDNTCEKEKENYLEEILRLFHNSILSIDNIRNHALITGKIKNKLTTPEKRNMKYTCSRCNASVLYSSQSAHEKTLKCINFGKIEKKPKINRKERINCCSSCSYETSRNNMSRHRKNCQIYCRELTETEDITKTENIQMIIMR